MIKDTPSKELSDENDIAQVNATAQIFSKLKAKWSKVEVDSLRGILLNKEQLRHKILSIQFV